MSKSETDKRGISILEVLITIAVLMGGLLVLIGIFPASLNLATSSEQKTQAGNLAQQQLETFISTSYSELPLGILESRQRLSADSRNPLYYFERETAVELVNSSFEPSASDVGLKKISVTVYYPSPSDRQVKSLMLSSIVSR